MHSVGSGTTHPTHWDIVVVMANGLRFEDSGWTLDHAYGVYEGYFETRSEAHEQGQRIARRLETRGHRFIGLHVYPELIEPILRSIQDLFGVSAIGSDILLGFFGHRSELFLHKAHDVVKALDDF